MSKRAEEIRKRIAMRKKERQQFSSSRPARNFASSYFAKDEEKHGVAPFDSYDTSRDHAASHPLFNKEWFMFKVLSAACLLLVVAIMFKEGAERFEPARDFVTKTMESEFQFAAVTTWYEDQFGKPLSLLPSAIKDKVPTSQPTIEYAVPASGKILENFEKNGQGVMVETGTNSAVAAINEGTIEFIGQKEEIEGITVIVQHSDGSESWYGNLEGVDVQLYDFVEQKSKIGTVTDSNNGVNGTFYFALKKGDSFIDPIQVINFE
jgi:stage IV sporulation protein FA